jgi:hypothetical protein
VASSRNPFADPSPIEQGKPGCPPDRVGCRLRDDTEFGLRLGKGSFDVEPCLPSVFETIECANARVGYASGGWEFIAHDASSV